MAGQQCLCVYHTCNRKRACAVSIQWLRGYRADIGAEFSLMADTLGRMETLAAGQSIFDTLVHRDVRRSEVYYYSNLRLQ